MTDQSKTKEALIQELAFLKQRIEELEQSDLERRRVEEKLRESEEKYRLAFGSTSDGIFTIDHHFNLSSITPSVEKGLGYKVEELMNRPIQDLNILTSESLSRAVSDVMQVLSGVEVTGAVYEFIAKDGTRKIGEVTGTPIIRENNVLGVTAVVRDITQRKRTEEALRESEEKYRSIVENINEAYFELDLKGNITFFSDPTCRISGFSHSELMGMNYRQYTSTETAKKLKSYFSNIYKTGEKWSLSDFELIRKDQNTRQMEMSVNLMRNSAGEAIGFRCIARDITERKQAEEEKQRLEERLNRTEKMEALGTLAGGVAHDLNNVLGVVVGYAELLLDEVADDSSIKSSVVNIMKGGERAATIVQDLLTLARRGVPSRQVLNLNKIIVDCQKSPELEKISSYHPSVKIKTDLEPDLLNISGSSVHLGKTLINLISNASESMPDGGIVNIKTANQYLDRPIYGYDEVREGDYVVLSISDTGGGISAADLKHIFEPFYTKKIMGRRGTGLGLAVVWGTVKDHHGYINVKSQEGNGSTFTLYFPASREDISSEAVSVSISKYMGKGESILVVDDVEGQRDLATEMLRKLNYSVTSVSSGEEAVVYLKEHNVDLMVLDMIMDPGMDGLDTYRNVLKIHPKQKAIIVSGFSETDRVNTAQSLGVGAYIRKPYVIENLGLAVRKELDQ